MIQLTIFKNKFDNKTHRRMAFGSFSDLEKLLYQLAQEPLETKQQAQLISPAVYEPDTTRANKNVTCWGAWAAVDVDEHVFQGDLESELSHLYGDHYYVCYSTASSTVEHPKFRLVFPLTSEVPADKIKSFWFALQSHLGQIGDKQTKDLSRMYYVPATYLNAYNFIFTNTGSHIDPFELMRQYPAPVLDKPKSFLDRLPPEMQKEVLAHRKNKASNTNITWSSYRDCPFIPKSLIEEYRSIHDTGWYSMMYKIMCSTALRAVSKGYPITSGELATLMKELDMETGNWYENRPLTVEAENAIEFAYRNGNIKQ